MKIKTIKKLCCSFDKSDLSLTIILQDAEDNIIEGILLCEHCKRIYPIISGIPIMSPDEYREFALEKPVFERWSKFKIAQNFRLIEDNI